MLVSRASAVIVINEVLTNPTLPARDGIELFDNGATPVDLGGWYLTDTDANLTLFQIPFGIVIDAGAYLVFDESALGFSLSANGESVFLTDADGFTIVDQISFGAAPPGVSYGRSPNGTGPVVLLESVTLGGPNSPPIPEPSTFLLAILGLPGFTRRRK